MFVCHVMAQLDAGAGMFCVGLRAMPHNIVFGEIALSSGASKPQIINAKNSQLIARPAIRKACQES